MEQLNIEALKQDYLYDREMIDGIMELILDVVCSKRKIICIAGDHFEHKSGHQRRESDIRSYEK